MRSDYIYFSFVFSTKLHDIQGSYNIADSPNPAVDWRCLVLG